MYTESNQEILHAVQETSSRYFNLEDLVINNLPLQIENEDLYTLEEVASIVSMSIVTIRQYVRTGKLKAIKQWKNWMVSSNEIAKLLYERKHGVKLATDEVMLTVVDTELYEEDGFINQYQVVTVSDILNSIHNDSSREIDRFIESMIPNRQGPCLYIEAVSNIQNFFRRAGEVQFKDLNKISTPLSEFIPENKESLKYIEDHVYDLIEEVPSKALLTIKEQFGDPGDPKTLLTVYKALLELNEMRIERRKENG